MPEKENYFRKRILSFKYAFKGVWQAIKLEANFRIHIVAAVLVLILSYICKLSAMEWLIVILTIGAVMSAELFNSAIEKFVDLIHPEIGEKAGLIKDISAGAVLILAIAAAVIGFIIFIPKLIALI